MKQINKDIRDLKNLTQNWLPTFEKFDDQQDYIDNILKPKWMDIYRRDLEMKEMNAESIRFMLRFNVKYRVEPLHLFGIYIDI